MYREADKLALEAFPNKYKVAVISAVIGVIFGIITAVWWNLNKLQPVSQAQQKNRSPLFFTVDDEVTTNTVHNSKTTPIDDDDSTDWFDHSLEDHDNEDGWCTECEEFEEDLED